MKKSIIKPVLVLLLLNAAFTAAAQVTDTVYIFDYSSSRNPARKTGREPLLLRFGNGDTLLLDAGSRGKKAGNWVMTDGYIPAGKCRVDGVRIIFDRNAPYCIQASGSDRYREKVFHLDTTLCITGSTTRPLVFWNVLRQQLPDEMVFKPVLFDLSNKEFAQKRPGHNKRMKRFYAAVSHEYNALTGKLTVIRRS